MKRYSSSNGSKGILASSIALFREKCHANGDCRLLHWNYSPPIAK